MAKIQFNLRLIMTVLFALACGAVAFLYPNWRNDLQAYTYYGYGGYGPRAFVTGGEGVKVVDLDTNLVVDSIGTGITHGIAVSSKGFAYVDSGYGILVIDTAINEVVEIIEPYYCSSYTGRGSEVIAVSPDGHYVYVTCNKQESIQVIDTASNAVVNIIPLGFNPIGIAVHPLGTRLYVANVQNTVSVINTNTYNVVVVVPVGLDPYGIAVRPDGNFVYVANHESGSVSVIDTSNNTVVNTIPIKNPYLGYKLHPTDITINQSGTKLYVATFTYTFIIDTATNKVDTIDEGSGNHDWESHALYGIAVHPTKKIIYITNYYDDALLVIGKNENTNKYELITGVSILMPNAVKIVYDAPNKPTLSSPANGATGVSTSPILDWDDVSGATSYKVQVCTDSSCSLASRVRTATTIESEWTVTPPLIPVKAPYYWRVKAINASGSSSWSNIWSFTTACPTLDVPILRSPSNGTIGVPVTPSLDWDDVSGATSYKVQVCTDSICSPISVARSALVSNSKWTVSPALNPTTTYYWRVSGINSCGKSAWSEVRSFKTKPTITVISPNGAENWQAGTTQTISWTYTGNPGPYVKIELFKNGLLKSTIKASKSMGTNGSGYYNWTIPVNQKAGCDYQIKITSTTNSLVKDKSDGPFCIYQ